MGILISVEFDRGSPGKFDSRTLSRKTINRWTGRKQEASPMAGPGAAGFLQAGSLRVPPGPIIVMIIIIIMIIMIIIVVIMIILVRHDNLHHATNNYNDNVY